MKLIIDIPDDKIAIEYGKVISIGRNNDKEFADYIFAGIPLEKHDEEVIKETVASVWGKPPYTEVLDKITAEIIELRSRQNVGVLECLNIIDKYRKGQTDADSD